MLLHEVKTVLGRTIPITCWLNSGQVVSEVIASSNAKTRRWGHIWPAQGERSGGKSEVWPVARARSGRQVTLKSVIKGNIMGDETDKLNPT